MDELLRRPAVELAGLIRAGEISSRELVDASLDAIERRDRAINAFTYVDPDGARALANTITAGDERPFAGVPIAIKDNRAVAGMPITMASDLYADVVPERDALLVARLRAAGFVIVGKTNMPENGILPTTEPRRFGPTANPWDLGRTPGGSSGGSAAAVAAGMVPIAHGNDGGGSIRIPAACCGVVGLKPARGRVSVGPDAGQSFLVSDGVLTRSVADTARALDVLAGYEPGDANWAPPVAAGAFAAAVAAGAELFDGPLRIGLALNTPLDAAEVDPLATGAARDAAVLLASLGHEVDEVTPPWSGLGLLPDFTRAFGPLIAMTTAVGGQLAGREVTEADVEPLTWAMYERSRTLNVLDHLTAQSRLEAVARSIVSWMLARPLDVIVTPALAERPLRTGEVHGRGPDPWGNYRRSGAFTPYTAMMNVTGQPAVVLPLYHGDDGLPLAVQLIGQPAREDVLLALGAQLEEALPWADRVPAGFE
ncbi:MAG TPA: amidase [Solirubrobacteraceae bacterium]|nr:amidase [Solirubrobacteraceae bacterium]